MASRGQLESQCGRSDVPVRTATETPSARASPRPPSNRLGAHGTRPLPDINPDRYRRAVWDDTNPARTSAERERERGHGAEAGVLQQLADGEFEFVRRRHAMA